MITIYVEGTKYPTLSMEVPMYNRLLNLIEDIFNYSTINALVRKLKEEPVLDWQNYPTTTINHLR